MRIQMLRFADDIAVIAQDDKFKKSIRMIRWYFKK
jgi:hypothetical protein